MLGSELMGGFANRNNIVFQRKNAKEADRDRSVKAFFLMNPCISLTSHLEHACSEGRIHLLKSSVRLVLSFTTEEKSNNLIKC